MYTMFLQAKMTTSQSTESGLKIPPVTITVRYTTYSLIAIALFLQFHDAIWHNISVQPKRKRNINTYKHASSFDTRHCCLPSTGSGDARDNKTHLQYRTSLSAHRLDSPLQVLMNYNANLRNIRKTTNAPYSQSCRRQLMFIK